jgi:indoleamine 2,3-dioxygenase
MSTHALVSEIFERHPHFLERGFLPPEDPLTHFPSGTPYEMLDWVGRTIPQAVVFPDFRRYASSLDIPLFSSGLILDSETMRQAQLYYVRVAFLASAYVHHVGQAPVKSIPRNIAKALDGIASLLQRPPILSYDGYALYNWRRIDPKRPIELGNIDTIQNFVDLKDAHGVNQESWFILVHIEIEAIAANIQKALYRYVSGSASVDDMLWIIVSAVLRMTTVLRRIPEHMDPGLYFSAFRPYIAGFEKMRYAGVSQRRRRYRGETGAQSSIMPLLEALLKIPHEPNEITKHLDDMRWYMPMEHVILITAVKDHLPCLREQASKAPWNAVLEAIAEFRSVHHSWAKQYIERHGDAVGTGKTPYGKWLPGLRDETLAFRK